MTQSWDTGHAESGRLSLALFFDRNFEAEPACLETCCDATRPPRCPPTTGKRHPLGLIDATGDYRAVPPDRFP